jgi:hypothetical protein
MRRLFAIFFLVISLSSYSEIGQFFKLPVLYAHFLEHKKENKTIRFWQFIELHYAGTSLGHTQDSHHGLPFKTSHVLLSGMAINIPLVPSNTNAELQYSPSFRIDHILKDQQILPEDHNALIFQPPRA